MTHQSPNLFAVKKKNLEVICQLTSITKKHLRIIAIPWAFYSLKIAQWSARCHLSTLVEIHCVTVTIRSCWEGFEEYRVRGTQIESHFTVRCPLPWPDNKLVLQVSQSAYANFINSHASLQSLTGK